MKIKRSLLSFAIQLLAYSGAVVIYLFVVLHLLSDWILQINRQNRQLYALLSLLLIVAQGMILESLTTSLLNAIHKNRRG